jgi:hypothetical protein
MDSEDLDVEAVGKLLAERSKQGRKAPTKDRLWSYSAARWRASVVRVEAEPSRFRPTAPDASGYDFTEDDIARAHYAGTGRAC